jgi:hypothetical protein
MLYNIFVNKIFSTAKLYSQLSKEGQEYLKNIALAMLAIQDDEFSIAGKPEDGGTKDGKTEKNKEFS